MGLSLIKAKAVHKNIPIIVNWAITGKCNLRCTHCYGSYGTVQKDELPTEQVLKIIDEAVSLGTRRITIEGGEPLVRKDIVQIIDYINKKGLECSLCTNGVLLDRYISEIKNKVDLVIFSIDGKEENHNKVRGKDNFKKVISAIELAKKNNLRTLIFSTLLDENIDDVDELVNLAKNLNSFIAFNIAVAKLNDDGKRIPLPKESEEKYRHTIKKILNYKKEGFPIFYSDNNFLQALNWHSFSTERLYDDPLIKEETKGEILSEQKVRDGDNLYSKQLNKNFLIPCFAGKYYCYIECNGDVYPCYQMVGLLNVKNAVKDGFKSAFEHLSTLKYCKHCYNITISELNLQCKLDFKSVLKVLGNYFK